MTDEPEFRFVKAASGDPNNDQMLAQTADELQALLRVTVHSVIDQAEEQDADLSQAVAALSIGWLADEGMQRDRLSRLLALALLTLAAEDREDISPGRTRRATE